MVEAAHMRGQPSAPVKQGLGSSAYVLNTYVFLWRSHTNMNTVFHLVTPLYGMDTYIFKLNVFTKQAKYE